MNRIIMLFLYISISGKMQQEDTETLNSTEMHQVDKTIRGVKNRYQVEASRMCIKKTHQGDLSMRLIKEKNQYASQVDVLKIGFSLF